MMKFDSARAEQLARELREDDVCWIWRLPRFATGNDLAAIASLRNNAGEAADQLDAAREEIAELMSKGANHG